MKKRKISAYEIALSAVACAFASIALILGTINTYLLFTGYLLGCFALMIPLAKGYYAGNVLAYIAACLIALMFNGFNFFDMLPFIVFFGLHPLVNELQLKYKWKTWIAFIVKALWFDVSMYLIWRFVFQMSTTVAIPDKFIVPVLAVGGTLFFWLYDYLMFRWRIIINRIVKRIIGKKK